MSNGRMEVATLMLLHRIQAYWRAPLRGMRQDVQEYLSLMADIEAVTDRGQLHRLSIVIGANQQERAASQPIVATGVPSRRLILEQLDYEIWDRRMQRCEHFAAPEELCRLGGYWSGPPVEGRNSGRRPRRKSA